MKTNHTYTEDCRETLSRMPDNFLNCVVTSPPYWGLRDYGHGDQLGLEETPQQYVENMVEVFREVKRALREDGTLWLNLGDSYSGSSGGNTKTGLAKLSEKIDGKKRNPEKWATVRGDMHEFVRPLAPLPPKNLVGIPWRVAFALQADGWYLRQDIIWHKPNPMPESVTDRCTKAHEYIFLLSKSPRYYYDHEAIKEKSVTDQHFKGSITHKSGANGDRNDGGRANNFGSETRNKRSVWTVTPKPYSEAHFATYPIDLIEPCILAGCPEGGIVYDPFMGSGTTALAAIKHNRKYIGSDLSYQKLRDKRIAEFKQHYAPRTPEEIEIAGGAMTIFDALGNAGA